MRSASGRGIKEARDYHSVLSAIDAYKQRLRTSIARGRRQLTSFEERFDEFRYDANSVLQFGKLCFCLWGQDNDETPSLEEWSLFVVVLPHSVAQFAKLRYELRH